MILVEFYRNDLEKGLQVFLVLSQRLLALDRVQEQLVWIVTFVYLINCDLHLKFIHAGTILVPLKGMGPQGFEPWIFAV